MPLPPGLTEFDALTPGAQERARTEILDDFEWAYRQAIQTRRNTRAQRGIHWAVNTPSVPHLLWMRRNQQRRRRDQRWLDDTIRDNLCLFHPDGTYFRFMPRQEPS